MLLIRSASLALVFVIAIVLFGNAISEGLLSLYHVLSLDIVYWLYVLVRVEAGIDHFVPAIAYQFGLAVVFTVVCLSVSLMARMFRRRQGR